MYEKLVPDGAVFKLEGDDSSLKELVVMIAGKATKLIKGPDGNFHFEKLPQEVLKPVPQKVEVVEVKLKEEEKKVLNTAFSNLEFESGLDVIKEVSFTSLAELSSLLKTKPNWMLRISGHTDNVGDPKKNMELSQKRAEAVRKFIMLSGLQENRTIVEGFGATKPVGDNKTPAGRAKNRRVEMTVVQDGKK